MKLSASQAAKETGKSIPTITRAINNGVISAEKVDNGKGGHGYQIDPAELFRVFPRKETPSNDTPDKLGTETPKNDSALQVEIQMLRERLADKDGVIDDLRQRLDAEAEERRKLTLILTDQTARPAAPVAQERHRRRWWHIGKAND